MNLDSDNELMIRVKDGEIDRLGDLFERHHRILFGYFYHLCHDTALSEDLVQNVFMRMLKYRHTYTNDGIFTTWMYAIARNVYIDHFRRTKKLEILDDHDQWNRLPGEDSQTESEDYNEKKIVLEKAMDQLSAEKKEALILSRYQGLKYKEIADVLGCSVGAVKVRIFRAINEMKDIVSKMEKGASI